MVRTRNLRRKSDQFQRNFREILQKFREKIEENIRKEVFFDRYQHKYSGEYA